MCGGSPLKQFSCRGDYTGWRRNCNSRSPLSDPVLFVVNFVSFLCFMSGRFTGEENEM